MSIKSMINHELRIFILAMLLCLFAISGMKYVYADPLAMLLNNTYQNNNGAGSIEGAFGMQIDTARSLAFVSSTTDDYLTAINFTNPSSLSVFGSVTKSGPIGSLDGIRYGTLDSSSNIFYAPSGADSTTSWYNVSTATFALLNDTAADTGGAGSQQGEYDVVYVDNAGTRWLIVGGLTDDIVSSFNVTDPLLRPAVVGSFADSDTACSVGGVRDLYNIPGTNDVLVASTEDSYVTLLDISTAGAITCVGSGYTDTGGSGSIQGFSSFYYESSTGYLYVPGTTDGYLTILNNIASGTPALVGSVGGLTTPTSVAIGSVGSDKYAFVGSTTAGQGIRVINITNPAAPTLYSLFNVTSGTCVYNVVNSMEVVDNYLYVTSGVDACFYVIELKSNSLMNVTLSYPIDNYFNDTARYVDMTFNATISDDDGLINCSLWTNYSGTWLLNQTQSTGGTVNFTQFNLTDLSNKTFIWNIQCFDAYGIAGWANANRTVILNWTPDVPPIVSLSFPYDDYFNNAVQFVDLTFNASVSDDRRLVNCSLWTNYSGTWLLNQTQNLSGTSNIAYFDLYSLTNKTFVWNIQCFDNESQSAFASANRTVILNWTQPPPANFSVQNYYFSLGDGVTSGFASFTGGQTNYNAVPFVTMRVSFSATNDFWNLFLPDVYFNSTGIIVTRNAGTSSVMNVIVSVVQFNPDSVRVQSGTFSFTSGSTASSIGSNVDLSRSALIFYYSSTDGTDDYFANSVRGNISGVNQLNFSVSGTTGVKSGHWYVFESIDEGYSVQRATLNFATTDTSASYTISSVDTSKSFLIASYLTSENTDDPRDGSFYVNLSSSTSVTGVRLGTPSATLNANVFVVTFAGDEIVRRGYFSYAATAGADSDILTAVNLSSSIAWNPVLTGRMADDSTGSAIESSFQLINLTSSTAITGSRAETAGNAGGIWEVIDWAPFQLPTIDSVSVDDNAAPVGEIVLSAGSAKFVNCTVIASDQGGAGNIINASATFYYYLNQSSDSDDNLVHYTNASCSTVSSAALSKTFLCGFNAYYYANNGTWHCNATVYNGYGSFVSANNSTIINPLYALNITDGLDYGILASNDISPEITANITNIGNMAMNITVQGYARLIGDNLSMNCSDGSNITAESTRFSLSSLIFDSKTQLNGSIQPLLLRVAKQTTLTAVVNQTYWQIQPNPNIGSSSRDCYGYILFSAESS